MRRYKIVVVTATLAAVVGAAWLMERPWEPTADDAGEPTLESKSKADIAPAKIEPQATKAEPVPNGEDLRLSQIQAQMEGLRQQLKAQRREITRLRVKATDRPVEAGNEAHEGSTLPDEDQDLARQQQDEARLAQLEIRFASQTKDPRWSRTAEDQIVAAIGQVSGATVRDLGQEPQLQDADCRNSLCRLTLTHKDEVSAERFVQEFPTRLSWRKTHGRVQTIRNPDGSVGTVVYLSREGQPLYEDREVQR